jgi:Nuclease-related domain
VQSGFLVRAGTKSAALMNMVFPKKSKKQPLLQVRRRAGQSIRDKKERLLEDRLMPYIFGPGFLWLIFVVESSHSWTGQPPQPRFWLCLAIAATGLSWIGFRRLLPKFRGLNRGERGELRVAEILNELRSCGYRAFHDLVGDGFNIDHVVVGPAGVFAIETKFRSGHGEIEFRNGEGLFVGGYPDEKDCLKQARGNAFEVNRIIKENCSFDEWVWPIVVFVGEWRVKNDWQTTDARVFTTNKLVSHIVNQQPRLKQSEINLIASHLERSVKSEVI